MEKLTDQPVLKVDKSSEETVQEPELGRPMEKLFFSKDGSSGIDVNVQSTSKPEMLVRVNACTDEVQNCRQVAETNTVILIESQNNETSESSGEHEAKSVTLTAKEDLEQEHLPIHERRWSFVPCSRDLPGNARADLSWKTALLTRHAGERERHGASSWKEYIGTIQRETA